MFALELPLAIPCDLVENSPIPEIHLQRESKPRPIWDDYEREWRKSLNYLQYLRIRGTFQGLLASEYVGRGMIRRRVFLLTTGLKQLREHYQSDLLWLGPSRYSFSGWGSPFKSLTRRDIPSCMGRMQEFYGQEEDTLTAAATCWASFRNASACGESGFDSTIGTPRSPASLTSASRGISPRNGTFSRAAV